MFGWAWLLVICCSLCLQTRISNKPWTGLISKVSLSCLFHIPSRKHEMMKTFVASLIAIVALSGCGFEEDMVKMRDVVIDACEREGGQLMAGGTVGHFGADGVVVACLYPPGKFPKFPSKK